MNPIIISVVMAFLLGLAIYALLRLRVLPFAMMAQNKSEVPSGFPKQTKTFYLDPTITSTADPLFVFKAMTNIVPLSLRFTAKTLDRGNADETYIISLEDDGTKISTNNSAATATQATYEATFSDKYIAKDSKVEIIFTLGGTTPQLGGVVVEFDYLEG